MPAFMDGPLGGNGRFDPATDEMGPPPGGDPMAQMMGGPPMGGDPMAALLGGGPPDQGPDEAGAEEESEDAKLNRLLDDALSLAQADTLSEQNRLKIQKVMTLIQEIKASEEKDVQAGKMTPGLLSKAYG